MSIRWYDGAEWRWWTDIPQPLLLGWADVDFVGGESLLCLLLTFPAATFGMFSYPHPRGSKTASQGFHHHQSVVGMVRIGCAQFIVQWNKTEFTLTTILVLVPLSVPPSWRRRRVARTSSNNKIQEHEAGGAEDKARGSDFCVSPNSLIPCQ